MLHMHTVSNGFLIDHAADCRSQRFKKGNFTGLLKRVLTEKLYKKQIDPHLLLIQFLCNIATGWAAHT